MQFDLSKVYTAVDADKIRVGSIGYGADTIEMLKEKVEADGEGARYVVTKITADNCMFRFCTIRGSDALSSALFYLIEEPKDNTLSDDTVLDYLNEHEEIIQKYLEAHNYISLDNQEECDAYYNQRIDNDSDVVRFDDITADDVVALGLEGDVIAKFASDSDRCTLIDTIKDLLEYV
jgi:hypothetical protein